MTQCLRGCRLTIDCRVQVPGLEGACLCFQFSGTRFQFSSVGFQSLISQSITSSPCEFVGSVRFQAQFTGACSVMIPRFLHHD